MAFVNLKPGTLLAPVPAVLVSCARKGEKPNAVTIAWAGTVNSDPPMVSVSVRPERYSHDIIEETGEFVVNLCGEKNLQATDWCGVKSGRDFDKFKECGLTAVPVEGMETAPAIAECPIYLACKVRKVERLGSHDMYIGEIVSMGISDELLDEITARRSWWPITTVPIMAWAKHWAFSAIPWPLLMCWKGAWHS